MQYIVVEFLFQACSTVAIGFYIPYKLAYRRFISIRHLSIGHFRVLDAVDARTRSERNLCIGGLSPLSVIAIVIRICEGRSFGIVSGVRHGISPNFGINRACYRSLFLRKEGYHFDIVRQLARPTIHAWASWVFRFVENDVTDEQCIGPRSNLATCLIYSEYDTDGLSKSFRESFVALFLKLVLKISHFPGHFITVGLHTSPFPTSDFIQDFLGLSQGFLQDSFQHCYNAAELVIVQS